MKWQVQEDGQMSIDYRVPGFLKQYKNGKEDLKAHLEINGLWSTSDEYTVWKTARSVDDKIKAAVKTTAVVKYSIY